MTVRRLLAPLVIVLATASAAAAQTIPARERLCDPTYEDCRADILSYIEQETVEIDMAYWMMTDARYSNALVAAHQRGVKIRVLMDTRCGDQHPACVPQNDQLAAAEVPMRNRITSGILHWKAIIFAGQQQIQFAGANYAPFELTPDEPWVNYTDEIVYFTNNPSLVHSFMRKFDDLWTSDAEFEDHANITRPLTRSYPVYPIDPELNFPPDESYRDRALAAYATETQSIDVLMFRITDEQHSDAMIAALGRGVPVRLLTDDTEYRNPLRLWHAYNVDKMYKAGVQVRVDAHHGINHEKAVLLRGAVMSIFGSSNWTSPSSDRQREHNLFTHAQWIYDWLEAQFTRKWTNGAGHLETKAFVPQPPDAPEPHEPAQGATGVATSGTSLSFYAGLWAHKYDIYFGTSSNPPLLEAAKRLGPSQYDTDYRYYALPPLQPNTTYYWKIVSRTMADLTAEGPIRSFTTGSTPPSNHPPSVSLTSPENGSSFPAPGTIAFAASASDQDGSVVRVDFYAGAVLIGSDTTAPFTFTWSGVAPGTYTVDAVATDDKGAIAASNPKTITVTNAAPSVSLTSPAGGATFTAPATIALAATATDSNGSVTRVDFYAGTTLLGSDTSAPYSFTWSSVPTGTYSLTAAATDNDGAATTSAAVSVTVRNPNVPPTVSLTAPSSGASYYAPATIAVTAAAGDPDGTVTKVRFFAGAASIGESTSPPFGITWNNVPDGTYALTAVAIDNEGAETTSAAVSITVVALPGRHADLAVYRPSSRTWHVLRSDGSVVERGWGLDGDVPAPGDYDHDGRVDMAVYRPSNGAWYILQSSADFNAFVVVPFGGPGAVPVPADYDGDGATDFAIYRPASGTWNLRLSASPAAPPLSLALGRAGDVPVPADYDGDGLADPAVYRASTGRWIVRLSARSYTTSTTTVLGGAEDVPIPADYDDDGRADVAIYRPSTRMWYLLRSSGGATPLALQWGLPGDIPAPLDFDGDGAVDPSVYRPSTGTWFVLLSSAGYGAHSETPWGLAGDTPLPAALVANAMTMAAAAAPRSPLALSIREADFGGDNRSDVTVFRPASGRWLRLGSEANYAASSVYEWGMPGDLPAPGDFDGDGTADAAVYRPSDGSWWVLESSSGFAAAFTLQWGLDGDTPVPADYDGDGRAEIAIYRPYTGEWYIRWSATDYATWAVYAWGLADDVPVPGDYDGDGLIDLAVHRPSDGVWYVRTSSSGYTATSQYQWGLAGDVAVPGDYDGDGRTDVAIYRPSSGGWYVLQSSGGYATYTVRSWGLQGDTAVPADYDGDGKTDLAVFRPGAAVWYILNSSTGAWESHQWGLDGDVPVNKR
jgi:hypothetical protein